MKIEGVLVSPPSSPVPTDCVSILSSSPDDCLLNDTNNDDMEIEPWLAELLDPNDITPFSGYDDFNHAFHGTDDVDDIGDFLETIGVL